MVDGLRPMKLQDCAGVVLRREDSLECRMTGARDDSEALRESLLCSTTALTWAPGGKPAAFAGLVDGLVSRIREDVDGFAGSDVAVVATGYTAPLMLPDLTTVEHFDQHLTLDGLRMVFERNQDGQRGRLKPMRPGSVT